ncbi:transposase [Streptomyces kebangsaanensis]|uniref:Mutator family transposase n=1 Tax=Streptomyces kebangsaanensis TaxID=864058 RepID=A0ABW6KNX7_9ACTN
MASCLLVRVSRDRLGSRTPRLLPKYAHRTGALDETVLSLTAKGLTSGEIVARLAEVYGTTAKETVSTATGKAPESMAEWSTRPLAPVCPVVLIDAVHVRIRDGHVANRPVCVAIAVTADGHREILHLIRNSPRCASRRDCADTARDLEPVHTAVDEEGPSATGRVQPDVGQEVPLDQQ